MKLNRKVKRLLSIVLSLALIVTSLTVGMSSASAAEGFTNIAKKTNSDGTFDVTWDVVDGAEFTKVYLLEGDQTEDTELTDGDAAKNKGANWIWNDNPQYGGAGEGKADGIVQNKSGTVQVTRGNTYTVILIAYNNRTTVDETTEIARTAVVVEVSTMTPEEESESIAKAEEESRQEEEIQKLNVKMKSSLALNKKMVAGSERTAGDVLSNINDGNVNTGYQSAEKSAVEDNWFYVDLGEEKYVNTVIIKWQAAHAAEYDIYVATTEDEEGTPIFGEPVASEKDAKEGYVTTIFETTKARYVKVATTKFDPDWAVTYGIKAFEFGVFGEGVEQETTIPADTEETTPVEEEGWIDGIVSEDNETWNDLGAWQYILMASNNSQAKIKGGDKVDNFSFRPLSTNRKVGGSSIRMIVDTVPGIEYDFSAIFHTISSGEKGVGRVVFEIHRNDGEKEKGPISWMVNLAEGENGPYQKKYTAEAESTRIEIRLGWIEPGAQVDLTGFGFEALEPEPPAPDPPTDEEIPEGYTLVPPNTDPWVSAGSTESWLVYAGAWSGTQYAYAAIKNGENPNELSVAFPMTTANDGWLVQVQYTFEDVNIGQMYKYEIKAGDRVLLTKTFTAKEPTYMSEKVGIGDTPEGSTLNLVATIEPYDPDMEPSPFPGEKKFDEAINSKYNVLLDAEYTQTSRHNEDTLNALTNGTTMGGYLCTGRGEQDQDIIITLKKEQDVADIAMGAIDFNNNLSTAAEYTISISQDGESYEEIGSYTTDNIREETYKKVALTVDTSNVTFEKYKYVKLNLNGENGFGYQITEFALMVKVIETPTEPPTSKPDESTTPVEPDNPTKEPDITTGQQPTSLKPQTTVAVKVGKTKVKSASKKKASKKLKILIKKISGTTKYQVQISKTKKFKKILVKKNVKKVKFTINSKKLKNKVKLYVRVRAYKVVNGKRYNGSWSKTKKITIKK